MKIEERMVEGRFLTRDNRFRVTVDIEGQHCWAHLANSGRLGELLVAGRRVILVERPGRLRKTAYDLALVETDGCWVSVDARLPNDLVQEALQQNRLPPLTDYSSFRREVAHGGSRFDFLLQADSRPDCLLEVKSATLVLDDLACFPDAVTQRGRRHVHELATAVEEGYRAVVAFVVQRGDATGVRPHDQSDPEFGRALREAVRRGVEVYAYACHVEPARIELTTPLPVLLDAS